MQRFTFALRSPEQAAAKAVDGRSDILSFGVMLYEMATGQRPFAGDSQASVLASVLREEPRPPAELRPDVPPELARLITRCLKKEPARRAQSMADLGVALTELKEESDSGTLMPPSRASVGATKRPWVWPGIALIALLIAAGLGIWRMGSGGSTAESPLEPVPLTSYTGNETQPGFSPDGNQVAFVWDGERQDNWDLYVNLIGSSAPLRLTTNPRMDYGPAWSPDGRNIAFLRRTGNDTVDVLLISPLGGPERRVAQFFSRVNFDSPMASLCWSADARFVFVSAAETRGQAHRMLRVSVDTGETTTLASAGDLSDGYIEPALSPDGSTLAMLQPLESNSVVLLALSKANEPGGVRKLDVTGRYTSVAWTADGRALIASIGGGNTTTPLYRIPVSGGPPQPLFWTGAGASSAAIAPAKQRLVFVRTSRDTNIWQVSLDRLRRREPALQKLASSSFREAFPQYSPDGKRLSFHSNRGGSVQIWTSDADGSRGVQLTSMAPLAITGTARWSPDGEFISFDSNADGHLHVYVVPSGGGRVRALTTGSSQNYVAAWSHDGRLIYFTSNRSGEKQVWRMPAAGGQPEQVTKHGGEAPDVSPDGTWLYFTKNDGAGGVWRMPIGGGDEARVIDSVFRYNFAIGKDGVFWVPGLAADRTSSIRFLDTTTGVATELIRIEKPVDLGLSISPDGRTLLFTQLDYAGQDLMLVEKFR